MTLRSRALTVPVWENKDFEWMELLRENGSNEFNKVNDRIYLIHISRILYYNF